MKRNHLAQCMSSAFALAASLTMLANAAHAAQPAPAELPVPFGSWGKQETVTFSTPDAQAPLRAYRQTTTMTLRAGDAQAVDYAEADGLPRVRSGNLAFDALFALAVAEMRQDSVAAIRDDSYNGGQPIACACFETGEKWHYVWTRDLSYGAALGLAMLDPERVRNSLRFKLSGYRDGYAKPAQVPGSADGLQIVQDTGSGGSWPVSTDRVTWAFGADETLKALPEAQRAAFVPVALQALQNTIEIDRVAAFDPATGLYNGEQSFLDWREQSYAHWIPGQLASMATSKALSTNVAHFKALTLAAQLAAEQGDAATARRYEGWAAALKDAINARLWLRDAGMYSSLTAGHFDGAPLHQFDWLGQALAIVTGIADAEQARSILERYPHGPMGAPVIWPQQPGRAIYHNRAIWPFVTAYGLKAAIAAKNVAVADAAYDTLLRGAAVNASNMENFEWLTGQPLLELKQDGQDLSGPVVNSRRQLWSVGGYVGAVVGGVFGIGTTHDGIAVKPFITSKLRNEAFDGSTTANLSGLVLRGHRIDVQVVLPAPQERAGYFPVQRVLLNGQPVGDTIKWSELAETNTIVVQLGGLLPGRQAITRVTAQPLDVDPAVFAPPEPAIASATKGKLTFAAAPPDGVTYNVYRDGRLVAAGLRGAAWTDKAPSAAACYAVEAVYTASGNRSHHSAPACTGATVDVGAGDARIAASVQASGGVLRNWGAPGDTFAARGIAVRRAGTYQVQVGYRNNSHQINLGITGGVKWLAVRDAADKVLAEGVVQLPHSPAGQTVYSTPLAARLQPGSYTVTLTDFVNMSSLQSNATYKDAGGAAGPVNRVDMHGIRLLETGAPPVAPVPRGRLEIVDDFASPQLSNTRKLRVWLPASYATSPHKRYPVLYMHDGQNLFDDKTAHSTEWHIDEVADRLAAEGRMREIIVVGIDNTPDRAAEYTPCCEPRIGGGKVDAYGRFVVDTVKPYIDRRYRTLPGKADTALMGSSFGGLATLAIAQRHPQVFGQAGIVSGSFWWANGTLIATAPRPAALPVRLYVDAGTAMDGIEATRDFHKALLAKGWRPGKDLLYVEDEGGVHNEQSWASRVHRALTWLFPTR